MHPEITIPELTEVVARLAALLGPREGTVVQLEGGITNRNFRVNFGGTDYVVRLPGKRHRRCSGSTARPSASPTRRRPSSAWRRRWPRCSRSPPAS